METCLQRASLFTHMDREQMAMLLGDPSVVRQQFVSGDRVEPRVGDESALGIVLHGHIRVMKQIPGHGDVLMSVLVGGDLLGAAGLFGQWPSLDNAMICITPCEVLLIPESRLRAAMRQNSQLAVNYVTYLTERIHFLNRRIEGFAGGSVQNRLARFLAGHAQICDGQPVVQLSMSMTALAQLLNVSRASLYRVLDEMESRQYIHRQGKCVWIDNMDALLAI